jgi:hypothetical protein
MSKRGPSRSINLRKGPNHSAGKQDNYSSGQGNESSRPRDTLDRVRFDKARKSLQILKRFDKSRKALQILKRLLARAYSARAGFVWHF